jgi:aromatic ring hydroxylase
MGLYNAQDLLAQEDQAYADRISRYLDHCREGDLCLTHGFADPPRDRGRPNDDYEALHVVSRRPDGIVIRGAKAVATLAPYADEYLGLTAQRPDLRPEEVVYFAAPLASPGLKVICRESFTQAPGDGHPLSAHYDEMDAFMVFEDVFVPWERVFFLDRVDLNERIFAAVPSAWAFFHILIRQSVKAEVFLGIITAMADYMGASKQPSAQLAMATAVGYLETLRAFIFAAEKQPVYSSLGLAIPNPLHTILGRIHAMERHPDMLQLLREVCGPGILMAPTQAEVDHPLIGEAVRRYLGGNDERAPDRFKLLKLAWDYAGDSFGSRQLLFEMYNAGPLAVNQARLVRSYDAGPAQALAKRLAGISASF